MNYCLAVMSCLQQGSETVILKARGRAISTAVDVAEVTRNRFLQDLTISGIEIGTEQVESSEGQNRTRNVSTIEITLKKG
jgi:DNA-binding protein